MKPYLAFWSYARTDDHDPDQMLTWLRERLMVELHVQSGEPHEIFQDVKDLLIGEDWGKELSQGLRNAIFLIPIITPTFMNSEACRDEVQNFLNREKTEGTPDLILPIYWTTSPLISDAAMKSTSLLAQQITKHQWDDWREYRLLSRSDPAWRPLLKKLAGEILARYKKHVLRNLSNAAVAGKIQWPGDGDRVSRKTAVKGRFEGLPSHCELWISVDASGKLHPQLKATTDGGKWSGKAVIGGDNSTGETYTLQLLAVTAETSKAFARYLHESGEAKQWDGVKTQEGCRLLHSIEVIRDDQAAVGTIAGQYDEYAQGPTDVIVTIKSTPDKDLFETTAERPKGLPWYGRMRVDAELPQIAAGTYGYAKGDIAGTHNFTINRSKGEIEVTGKILSSGATFKTTWKRRSNLQDSGEAKTP